MELKFYIYVGHIHIFLCNGISWLSCIIVPPLKGLFFEEKKNILESFSIPPHICMYVCIKQRKNSPLNDFYTGNSVVVPEEGTLNWWTFLGHIDPRLDLTKSSSLISYLPQLGALNTMEGVNLLELLLMASKVAYENEAYVKNAVTNHWKVWFRFSNESTRVLGEKLSP